MYDSLLTAFGDHLFIKKNEKDPVYQAVWDKKYACVKDKMESSNILGNF